MWFAAANDEWLRSGRRRVCGVGDTGTYVTVRVLALAAIRRPKGSGAGLVRYLEQRVVYVTSLADLASTTEQRRGALPQTRARCVLNPVNQPERGSCGGA